MTKMVNINQILFLDIETVPAHDSYEKLGGKMKELWDKKASFFLKDEQIPKDVYQRAGIYAEFGKIVCISTGYLRQGQLRIKSFYGENEKELLEEFAEVLTVLEKNKIEFLCAHNGKEFDFPFIARRMLINQLKLPPMLDIAGLKPWEVKHVDTMELWKFGDYKNYTSLSLLCEVFDIPTPKDDIDGSMIYDVYYQENDLDRIVKYCQKDVLAIVRLYQRFCLLGMISDEQVQIII